MIHLSRLISLTCVCSLIASAHAFHPGDNIYGAVNGQIVTVDPTNALTNPQTYSMSFIASTATTTSIYFKDVGFDNFDLGTNGILGISSAKLNGRVLTPGLEVRRGTTNYFTPTAPRQNYLLAGSARHAHFGFYTRLMARKTYVFEYWFTEAFDENGVALMDSPRYRLIFNVTPQASATTNLSPVPEPATLLTLGLGMVGIIRRKQKSAKHSL
jgi:hypothetical protein